MMNDIVPPPITPRPPQEPPVPPANDVTPPPAPESPILGDILSQPQMDSAKPPEDEAPFSSQRVGKRYHKWLFIAAGLVVLVGGALFAGYQFALQPVISGDPERVRVTVAPGSSPTQIGALLAEKKVIRSKVVFDIYIRLNGVRSKLRAGTYSLSPAESTAQVVAHLTTGEAEQFDVTFYPGATLNIASTAADKTPSHRQVLQKLGYSDEEINEAFNASYVEEYPVLFADKPATADLEGYIYGQTYKIASGSTVKQVLRRTFAEYEKQITDNHLAEAFKAQNLSLYEGITLASIIQREVPTAADQKQVAQVFLKRYRAGGTLGSDVTYHYAADKRGVPRDHTLDDPYNTRIKPGLPPGPISSPGISSLLAVAAPAEGDYEFFLSGDDDKTYFAHTQAEHEANIVKHCTYKCSLP